MSILLIKVPRQQIVMVGKLRRVNQTIHMQMPDQQAQAEAGCRMGGLQRGNFFSQGLLVCHREAPF